MYYSMEPPIIPNDNELNNVLRMNNGKKVIIYLTNNQEFQGIIEKANKDFIVISNPLNGKWVLIFNHDISYITFEEKMNYQTDFIVN